ncbi:STAS-like domain-containing protein [Bartonella apis]|uniref:STAS-like domain-containing protein n=1 Tax=Bartonella apis TaxID=1686310 RepID=UPI0026EC3015|nr:STAS-like domain-containing protein [Bartonella apis]
MSDIINLANDFSRYPAGRFSDDGSHNGSKFRDEILWPRLENVIRKNDTLTINIDDVRSLGSSFIDEAFVGLLRKHNITKEILLKYLDVKCTQPDILFFRDAIIDSIKNS